jgi:hypothetical protein
MLGESSKQVSQKAVLWLKVTPAYSTEVRWCSNRPLTVSASTEVSQRYISPPFLLWLIDGRNQFTGFARIANKKRNKFISRAYHTQGISAMTGRLVG